MDKEKKILLIEDDKTLAKILSKNLEDNNYQVSLASTGKDGLKKAQAKPDLILLDLVLPGDDGIAVLKKLKADEATEDIPVIILTNLGDKETISKILNAGGKEYLVKTDWKIEDIIKKIEASL